MARVDLLDREDLPPEYRELIVSSVPIEELDEEYRHLMSKTERNSYRAIGHLPPVLETYRELIDRLKRSGGLSTREQELVILAVARELNSEYEWHNHVRIALHNGLSADEILAVSRGEFDEFDPAEAALMRYAVDHLRRDVTDDSHAAVAAHFDEPTVVGLGLFVGYWLMNETVLDALAVDVEEPFVGWELENL